MLAFFAALNSSASQPLGIKLRGLSGHNQLAQLQGGRGCRDVCWWDSGNDSILFMGVLELSEFCCKKEEAGVRGKELKARALPCKTLSHFLSRVEAAALRRPAAGH